MGGGEGGGGGTKHQTFTTRETYLYIYIHYGHNTSIFEARHSASSTHDRVKVQLTSHFEVTA